MHKIERDLHDKRIGRNDIIMTNIFQEYDETQEAMDQYFECLVECDETEHEQSCRQVCKVHLEVDDSINIKR